MQGIGFGGSSVEWRVVVARCVAVFYAETRTLCPLKGPEIKTHTALSLINLLHDCHRSIGILCGIESVRIKVLSVTSSSSLPSSPSTTSPTFRSKTLSWSLNLGNVLLAQLQRPSRKLPNARSSNPSISLPLTILLHLGLL
jgi:hypothetical protein